jgi:hypothetical protein
MADEKYKERIQAVIQEMPPEVFGFDDPSLVSRALSFIGIGSDDGVDINDLPEVFYDDVLNYSDNASDLSDKALENIIHLVMAREKYHPTKMNDYPDEDGKRKLRLIKGQKYDQLSPEFARWTLTNMPVPDLGLEMSYDRLENQPVREEARTIGGEPIPAYLDSKTISEIVDKGQYRFANGTGNSVRMFYTLPDGLEMEVPSFQMRVAQGGDGRPGLSAEQGSQSVGIFFPNKKSRRVPEGLFDDGAKEVYLEQKITEARNQGFRLDKKEATQFAQILSDEWEHNQRVRRFAQGDLELSAWERIEGSLNQIPKAVLDSALDPIYDPDFIFYDKEQGRVRIAENIIDPIVAGPGAAARAVGVPLLQGRNIREAWAEANADNHTRDIYWYEKNAAELGRAAEITGGRFAARLEGAAGSTFEQVLPESEMNE